MAHEMPTRARLHELFDDGGDTLIYRVANTRMPAGARVVSKTSSGYLRVYVDNKRYLVHRLLWVYRGGSLTTQCKVDHRDGNQLNNRDGNLRLATHAQNMQNTKQLSNNTSGIRGVSWHKASRQWLVQVNHNRQYHYGGLFRTLDEAGAVATALRARLHGEFTSRR